MTGGALVTDSVSTFDDEVPVLDGLRPVEDARPESDRLDSDCVTVLVGTTSRPSSMVA